MTIYSENPNSQDHVEIRLDKSSCLLGWLSGELACWAPDGGPDGGAEPMDVGTRALATSEGASRLARQMSRLCELVKLAVDQLADHGDLGLSWMLLEQARQQLGHAANVAADVPGSGLRKPVGAEGFHGERKAVQDIRWFLQRDLLPWSDDASVMVEFGFGPDMLPDFRPDTPLEFGPLQLLAHASMTGIAGEMVSDPDDRVMRMAFGEYVGWTLDEAMELLDVAGDRSGARRLSTLAETGWEAGELLTGAFPMAEEIFRGPAGFPGASDD